MSSGKKYLVTGGAGNIGSALAKKLAENKLNHVVVVDNLSTGSIHKLDLENHDNISFIKADVNYFPSISTVMCSTQFDFVFHYAAVVGVQRTLDNPVDVLNDIEGIKNILELSKDTGVKRVVYSSSSEVYGEPFEVPQNEATTPLNSRLPYAVVKNLGEAFCHTYFREYALPYTVFRFFNTYGPNQSQDFVLPRFIQAAINNEPITVYGDGQQTRTFCYIDDNIEATLAIIESEDYVNATINLGSDREMSILQLAELVLEVSGSQSEIIHAPALSEGDMTRRCPDISKMRTVLNRELVTLEDGIIKLVNHYRKI